MKYWKITPGQGGYLWREQKLNECIAIGWSDTGDLRKSNLKSIGQRCSREGFSTRGKNSAAGQLNAFVNEVQMGDKVVASTSSKGIYAVGTITGDYEFNKNLDYKHSRKVRWETTFWHPVSIESLNLGKKLYNKFHARSSFTIRELAEDEWTDFCKKLNNVPTPFRNLGMWAGLLQSPEYENEVMILFSHMLQHFNMRIIQFGVRFPDAVVEQKIGKKWKKRAVEFELYSSGFKSHLSVCGKVHCDIIVCWEDDWESPVKKKFEVINLKRELEKIL